MDKLLFVHLFVRCFPLLHVFKFSEVYLKTPPVYHDKMQLQIESYDNKPDSESKQQPTYHAFQKREQQGL